MKQQGAEIGRLPGHPETFRGRLGAFLPSLVRRSFEGYIQPLRGTIEAVAATLEEMTPALTEIELRFREQAEALQQARQHVADLELRSQELAEALQQAQHRATGLELRFQEQLEALQWEQHRAAGLEHRFQEQARELQQAQQHATELDLRFQQQAEAVRQVQHRVTELDLRFREEAQAFRMDLHVLEAPVSVLPGAWFKIRARLRNWGSGDLVTEGPNPILLSYHCYDKNREVVTFDGHRTAVPCMKPAAGAEVDMDLEAPRTEGRFLFRITLVQELVRWLDTEPQNLRVDTWIRVVNPAPVAVTSGLPELRISRLQSCRLLLTSTPRSGNTWFRFMLQMALGGTQTAVDSPLELDWESIPDRFVGQMHWRCTPEIVELLNRVGILPLVIIRHPLDVLLSILHFCTFEPRTARWLEGEAGSEASILGRTPADREFLDYALSARAEALLSISPPWMEQGWPFVRYEDLVARPAAVLEALLSEQQLIMPIDRVVEECKIEKLRVREKNRHFWRGQPGLWRSLIPENWASQIYARHEQVFRSLGYDVEGARPLNPSDIEARWMQF